ncbi:MAG: YgiQ family radical SAM protein [Mariprofundales bacterium]
MIKQSPACQLPPCQSICDALAAKKHAAKSSAPFLPMTKSEMNILGWHYCDIILITGDAYVDHPSFGMAIIGRFLESLGYKVGIIAQPDWRSAAPFRALGRPRLFFGITAGNMDSMVNHYTSERKIRSDDAYTAGGKAGQRPDRAAIVYSQRAREAFSGVNIILGGIEASLRRVAHYDYWSDKVRRSILLDSKADLLVYGNGERQLLEISQRLNAGESVRDLHDIRGTAYVRSQLPEEAAQWVHLPDYITISNNTDAYAEASGLYHNELNPFSASTMVQEHDGKRFVIIQAPVLPLETTEMDAVFAQNFARRPHPSYRDLRIPAYEMIRFSVNIMRGCFGGCSFCSITEHEGSIIQNRSPDSIVAEIADIRDKVPEFSGTISDLGGPTANMYSMRCRSLDILSLCRKPSCVWPKVCKNLITDHDPLVKLYKKARQVSGIKRILIASGVRYDLAVLSPEYMRELAKHHVGGYLKIAPEHSETSVLDCMLKPELGSFEKFRQMFDKYSREAGKKQYIIPYFIAAHPGCSDEDMLFLAQWLKANHFRPDQVQAFLPSPMALATAMYHTGRNPLKRIKPNAAKLFIAKGERNRRLHKAFLRYFDHKNWSLLRQTLKRLGREDLIGNDKNSLVPPITAHKKQQYKKR